MDNIHYNKHIINHLLYRQNIQQKQLQCEKQSVAVGEAVTDRVSCTHTDGVRHVTPAKSDPCGYFGAGLFDGGGWSCEPFAGRSVGRCHPHGEACYAAVGAAHPPSSAQCTWHDWVAQGDGPSLEGALI